MGSVFETYIHYFKNYTAFGSKIGLGAFFEVQFKMLKFVSCTIVIVCRCGNQLSMSYQMFLTCYATNIV